MATDAFPREQRLTEHDPWLAPYTDKIGRRLEYTYRYAERIVGGSTLADFAQGHHYFGLHREDDATVLREWAPTATKMYLVCEENDWKDDDAYAFTGTGSGQWELVLPPESLPHGSMYKLHMYWEGGDGYRVPAWAMYVIQNEETKDFTASVWQPEQPFEWHDADFAPTDPPLIYEAHIGMSGEKEEVSSYADFARDILPRIKTAGYNTVQLMAVAEHPYYGSFGYHVSSFFAPSSRFGTPDDLRALVDAAHNMGLRVIMDIVHSHAVKNEAEGLSKYDGSLTQFFHAGDRGNHEQWDSRVFDYGKSEVAHFLLSNCRYWLEEFHMDGFRFDGVTSMLYTHHGMGRDFTNYDVYFEDVDSDALAYLTLANKLIHAIKPPAITIAEDMSGMPGLAAPITDGGVGFDYRLSMGVPDMWIKYVKEKPDEQWNMSHLMHELSQHRPEEKTIVYAESHDQALVGDKTLIFRLADKEMYDHMLADDNNLVVDRAIALHKMIRLLTSTLHHGGYLNFMGNEFGHPEWIDFPREGNGWSYKYARRQWSLRDDKSLKYRYLADFDRSMLDVVWQLSASPEYAFQNDGDHVLSFVRDGLLHAFNFHPEKSFSDYPIPAPTANYKACLSTDSAEFGGFGRIDTSMTYPSGADERVKLYLPARTAVVLRRYYDA